MAELTRIACVEDDADIQAIIELALTDIGGFKVTIFSDGPAALAGLSGFAPQLVMLDMMMPGMNGLEVLARIRSDDALQGVPVVFMTAKAQAHEVEQYKAAGAQATILKPFDPISLPDQIRDIWNGLDRQRS
jgi:CheY-like chemotaxis protein